MLSARRWSVLAFAAVVAGCGGSGGSGTTTPPPPAPSIALTVGAPSVSIAQGGSDVVSVSVARTNYNGDVTISASGAPAGITVSPTTLASGATGGTLQIVVSSTAATGSVALTITASGSGVSSASGQLSLTVTGGAVVVMTATAVSIPQGGQGTSTIGIARTSFSGALSIALQTAPAGVTGTFSPQPATGAASTLSLTIAPTVAPGIYTVGVQGTGQGVAPAVANLSLTVVASSFALSATPGALNVAPGGAVQTATINVARTNFALPVQLSVTGAPAGMTATLDSTTLRGTTARLSVSASGTVAAGSYALVIRASAAPFADQTTTVNVTVTGTTSGSITLDLRLCSGPPVLWFAFQDGPGAPWTRVIAVSGTYSFSPAGTKVGIVLAASRVTRIFYMSVSELRQGPVGTICEAIVPTVRGKDFIVQISGGLANNDLAILRLGSGVGFGATANQQAFIASIPRVTETTILPLFAYREPGVPSDPSAATMVLRRGIDAGVLPDGALLGAPINFTSEGVRFATAQMTVAGLRTGESAGLSPFVELAPTCRGYRTPMGWGTFDLAVRGALEQFRPDSVDLFPLLILAPSFKLTGNAMMTSGVPPSLLTNGETNGVLVLTATDLGGLSQNGVLATSTRSLVETFRPYAPRTIPLPSAMPAITPTILPGAYRRFRYQYTLPADLETTTIRTSGNNVLGTDVVIKASAAYLGGRAVDITTPDFSAVPGWDNRYGTQGTVSWEVRGESDTRTSPCAIGRTVSSSVYGVS